MIQIKPEVFYLSGYICFGVVFIGSLMNLIIYFEERTIINNISLTASTVFNFVLWGFFYYLYRGQSNLPPEPSNNVEEALQEFKKWEKNKINKKS